LEGNVTVTATERSSVATSIELHIYIRKVSALPTIFLYSYAPRRLFKFRIITVRNRPGPGFSDTRTSNILKTSWPSVSYTDTVQCLESTHKGNWYITAHTHTHRHTRLTQSHAMLFNKSHERHACPPPRLTRISLLSTTASSWSFIRLPPSAAEARPGFHRWWSEKSDRF